MLSLLKKHYKCLKVPVLSKDRTACPGCQACPQRWKWEMANVLLTAELFTVPCFAASAALV